MSSFVGYILESLCEETMRLMKQEVVEFLQQEAFFALAVDGCDPYGDGRIQLAREVLNMMEIPYEKEEDKK